jgi:hypothetical protein
MHPYKVWLKSIKPPQWFDKNRMAELIQSRPIQTGLSRTGKTLIVWNPNKCGASDPDCFLQVRVKQNGSVFVRRVEYVNNERTHQPVLETQSTTELLDLIVKELNS